MPTTTQRGYGRPHRQERARLKIQVDAGRGYCRQGLPGNGSSGTCLHLSRHIAPGTRWVLGHNDARTDWIGEVHADCNQRDGASRGGKAIAEQRRHFNSRVCPICRNDYQPISTNQRTCHRQPCRAERNRRWPKRTAATQPQRTCPTCDITFTPHAGNQVSCSPTCAKRRQRQQITDWLAARPTYAADRKQRNAAWTSDRW